MNDTDKTPFFPGWLFLLAMLTALSPLSVDLYLPAFPSIGQSLGVESSDVQITLAIFLLGMSLGQLLYGPLSDRYGRKPPLYVGLALYIVASLGCMLANDLTTLTASRFLQALGGSAGVVICRAVIRDRTTTAQAAWAFSMLMLALGLAPILAPMLGGLLLMVIGWRGIFAVLAGAGLVLLLSMHFSMRETLSRHTSERLGVSGTFRRYGSLLGNGQFMMYVLIGALPFGGMFAYIAGSPYVIIELYGVPAEHFGWFFGINAFGMIAGSQFNARLVARFGPATMLKYVIRVPVVAALTGLVATLLGVASLPLLMICFFVYMTSMGLLTPNAVALAMANEGHRAGSASAIMGSIQFLLGTCGAAAVSIWTMPSAVPLTGVMLLLSGGSLLIHQFGHRRDILIRHGSDIEQPTQQ
ncbi:MAG: multidrug effflux MFS transporter [Pseudomonas profundi]|uniref:Bcr/CflA family efflux transporter n=1 Tax=Halopseudomonas litoralis TaxID=797277 RepID=A0A1H1W2I4_9GAMM|nr:multidrug effflux MFS transporter [Halopseudomonas litoralis]SDS91162.1 MFS transporter, DHA1 family, bicyclomycin/chloramphenicol resistance protein [Halopseudomonas litoralis]